MAEKSTDLWPEDFGNSGQKPPLAILREQAEFLGRKTKNLVEAEVVTQTQGDKFLHRFVLVAPALDHYRYVLFSVEHGVSLYPLRVHLKRPIKIDTEKAFVGLLKRIFLGSETKKIVQSLISQSQVAA